jgi:hypothetical protein
MRGNGSSKRFERSDNIVGAQSRLPICPNFRSARRGWPDRACRPLRLLVFLCGAMAVDKFLMRRDRLRRTDDLLAAQLRAPCGFAPADGDRPLQHCLETAPLPRRMATQLGSMSRDGRQGDCDGALPRLMRISTAARSRFSGPVRSDPGAWARTTAHCGLDAGFR